MNWPLLLLSFFILALPLAAFAFVRAADRRVARRHGRARTDTDAAAAQRTPCNGVTTGVATAHAVDAGAAQKTPCNGVTTGVATAHAVDAGAAQKTPCNGVATGNRD
jgi:hypothetical protein